MSKAARKMELVVNNVVSSRPQSSVLTAASDPQTIKIAGQLMAELGRMPTMEELQAHVQRRQTQSLELMPARPEIVHHNAANPDEPPKGVDHKRRGPRGEAAPRGVDRMMSEQERAVAVVTNTLSRDVMEDQEPGGEVLSANADRQSRIAINQQHREAELDRMVANAVGIDDESVGMTSPDLTSILGRRS